MSSVQASLWILVWATTFSSACRPSDSSVTRGRPVVNTETIPVSGDTPSSGSPSKQEGQGSTRLGAIDPADGLGYAEYAEYDGVYTRDEIDTRLRRALVKSPELWEQIQLLDDSFAIYASADDLKKGRPPEFKLRLRHSSEMPPISTSSDEVRESLKGVRIALDPGHIGGQVSRDEGRYINDLVDADGRVLQALQFDEGTLTLATAKVLKEMLEAEGAEVFVTRERVGEPVYLKSFDQWMSEDAEAAIAARLNRFTEADRPAERRRLENRTAMYATFYNSLDLVARAQLIAEFQPHASVVIHYNAGHEDREKSGQNRVHSDNRNLVFTPGSFMRGELSSAPARLEFVRLLVTSDLNDSAILARETLRGLSEATSVPAFLGEYMPKSCLTLFDGVFARNMLLTRMIRGPLVYGEAFFQENEVEALRLAQTDFEIDGVVSSSRVRDVALGYYVGLKRYFLGDQDRIY